MFDNIFNILLPNYLTHVVFKPANRFKSQHPIAFLVLAFCTIGLYTHVGQAGIGNIDQVKVSNYRLVPKDSVITAHGGWQRSF